VVLTIPFEAYLNVYKNFDQEKIHWMDEISKHPKLRAPRLDLALQKEIDRGSQDVYLPNDTHWGTTGHKVTAHTLINYLSKNGVLRNKGD
jgi:hypothetical protein